MGGNLAGELGPPAVHLPSRPRTSAMAEILSGISCSRGLPSPDCCLHGNMGNHGCLCYDSCTYKWGEVLLPSPALNHGWPLCSSAPRAPAQEGFFCIAMLLSPSTLQKFSWVKKDAGLAGSCNDIQVFPIIYTT